MSEEDEVFLEKSFQRTLIVSTSLPSCHPTWKAGLPNPGITARIGAMSSQQELEKLISYSATPTAVWRRTGEVCYANPEFCRLVGRSESDLCSKKSYVYTILAKPS